MPLLTLRRAKRHRQLQVSFTSILVKVVEQLILKTISRSIKEKKIIGSSQEHTNGKSSLTNLLNFHNQTTGLVEKGRVVNIVCLDFRKAFDTISHKILIYKMLKYGQDKQTER